MKTIGLLGGMSWESSLEYYRIINQEVRFQLGGTHSAKCVFYSFDFHEVEMLQDRGDWEQLNKAMVGQALNLKKAGAEFVVICSNTMHLSAVKIESETGLQVLHIADVTGEKIRQTGLNKVALLGTRFTMEGTFYQDVLKDLHGIEVIIPPEEDRQIVDTIIYAELVVGKVSDQSKEKYVAIIEKLALEGAEGVILGCTEIPLLIKQEAVSIPVFDTTTIHAKAAVRFALEA